MSDPAGRLNIQLRHSSDGLCCAIRSSRPVTASAVLRGRTAAETASLLPMLYSICAKAQAYACVGALESALDLTAPAEQWQRRTLTLQLETVREHLWRMLLDWPRILDAPPEREALAGLLPCIKSLFAIADPSGRLFQPAAPSAEWSPGDWSQWIAALQSMVAERILGRPARQWLEEIGDEAALRLWAETKATGPARLIRSVIERDECDLGCSAVTGLPPVDDQALAARLLAAEAADFVARPTWDGTPRETSPLTRTLDAPLIRALRAAHGNGLLTRLAAQVLEVAALSERLPHTEPQLEETGGGCASPAPGIGIGRAEAARGRLVHLAQLEQDRVAEYRILAPTEWNFHPEGPLAAALSGLAHDDAARLRRQAELLVMAIDPCVAYDLSLSQQETDVGMTA